MVKTEAVFTHKHAHRIIFPCSVTAHVNDLPQSLQSIQTETIAATQFFAVAVIVVVAVDFPKSQPFVILLLVEWIQMFWIFVNRSMAGRSQRLFTSIHI